ncbi:MAG: YlzJ-like family protein [Armatimonadetes bacterium]|nr:YlzJ-like family protein [Armatimonadota bacterium]
MILYTPLPIELVSDGLQEMKTPAAHLIDLEGVTLMVEDAGPGEYKVLRLLSTNPYDYLRPNLHPGAIVKYQR